MKRRRWTEHSYVMELDDGKKRERWKNGGSKISGSAVQYIEVSLTKSKCEDKIQSRGLVRMAQKVREVGKPEKNVNMEIKVKEDFFRNVISTKKQTTATKNKPVENVTVIIKKYVLNFSNQDEGREWEMSK